MGQKYSYDIMFLDGNAGKNLTNQNLVVCELPPIGADVMIENKVSADSYFGYNICCTVWFFFGL